MVFLSNLVWSSTKIWNLEKKRREEEGKLYCVSSRARPVMLLTSYRTKDSVKEKRRGYLIRQLHTCARHAEKTTPPSSLRLNLSLMRQAQRVTVVWHHYAAVYLSCLHGIICHVDVVCREKAVLR